MNMLVKALSDDVQHSLGLSVLAGSKGLSRCIQTTRIDKSGLAVAGLVKVLHPRRIQVLGKAEVLYLSSLKPPQQLQALQRVMMAHTPCLVVTCGESLAEPLLELAEEKSIAVLSTALSSNVFITRVQQFLQAHLSPEMNVHGVLVDTFGVGVLLTGQSGIGKSECALDLILRGHRLIADDVVVVRQQDMQLIGISSPLTKHHMEVRGLGIINVCALFGAGSVCEHKRIDLVVEIIEWQREANYDRLGVDDMFETILNIALPQVRLPVRPGRNIASVVEVAARNYLLKRQGQHSARQFSRQLEKHLAQAPRSSAETL